MLCADMETSLASIFMDASLPGSPIAWPATGETVEELQQKLAAVSMELESVRETARLQSRISETKICHLQNLLDALKKERDEALMKCSKLQACILHLSSSTQGSVGAAAAASPNNILPPSASATSASSTKFTYPASPTNDTISFRDPSQADEKADISIFEHDTRICHGSPVSQDIFALEQNPAATCISMGDSVQQQFHVDILNENVSTEKDQSLGLIDLRTHRSRKSPCDLDASSDDSKAPLTQSSCISSAGSRQAQVESDFSKPPMVSPSPGCMHHPVMLYSSHAVPLQNSTQQHVMMPHLRFTPHTSRITGSYSSGMQIQNGARPHLIPHLTLMPEVPTFARSHSSSARTKGDQVGCSQPQITTFEVDALPEKGKLLQAVMQAGPLLHNLLLAGPLPQWKYPPPQL
ncbi:hypothetical protein KP509_31G068500 [Ceratopteris richardii]|uniref:Uncharacterized protein n=1 Tax=Ceratopteris richardii TaxID=49495 RepID=A0A8T2QZP3_CERRI|nr:hypothetical protein KP509_31G068500 [Ceratopteris richardii]